MNKIFWKSALIRAIRTVAQTAVASIGTAAVIEAVDWKFVVSASILAGILSILTSIATGLPEAGSIVIEEDDLDFEDEDAEDDVEIEMIEADPATVREDIEVRDGEEEQEE